MYGREGAEGEMDGGREAGISIKAGYWQSTTTCRTSSTTVCLDFINESKNDISKKSNYNNDNDAQHF